MLPVFYLSYVESDILPIGTQFDIDRYNITGVSEFAKEMEEKGLSGRTGRSNYHCSRRRERSKHNYKRREEENIGSSEETVNENDTKSGELQVASAEEVKTNSDTTEKEENATTFEKKQKEKPKKKKKTIKIEKEKKKLYTQILSVTVYHTIRLRPYFDEIKIESLDKLDELTRMDNERIALEESRNEFEAYTYHIKNKIIDDEEVISAVSIEE